MKKIKEIKKEKDSKTVQKVIIGGVIAFLMVFSILGFFSRSNNTSKKLTYNGFKFTLNQNGLFLVQGKTVFSFKYFPTTLENMTYDRNIDSLLQNAKMIYITSDNNDTFVQQIGQVKYLFASQITKMNRFVQNSYTSKVDGLNLPEITCLNATQTTPVIYFLSSNQTTINLEKNCIIIKATDENNFFMPVDRMLYGFLGVIK